MIFWIAILAGVLFVWLAVRLGFYATWVLLFNVVISIYVAVLLAPLVADLAPAAGVTASYSVALSLIVLAGGCFALLHGLSYVFLTGQFNILFPRVFDIVLSGVLGFASGFLILSFGAIVLTTTPLAQHKIVSSIGFSEESQRANIYCIERCCDLIHAVAGFGDGEKMTGTAIHRLLDIQRGLKSHDRERAPDANEPPAAPRKEPHREFPSRRKITDPTGAL
jgi:hypothetical protein